jgi:hypothetical protein
MKIFWDIMPCSPFEVIRRFGGTYRLLLLLSGYLAWLIPGPWRWRRYIPYETSVDFQRTTRLHIPEDRTFQLDRCSPTFSRLVQPPSLRKNRTPQMRETCSYLISVNNYNTTRHHMPKDSIFRSRAMGTWHLKKNLTFYGSQRFVTVSKRASHWSLSKAKLILPTSSNHPF